MVFAVKLKIGDEHSFEEGKDHVESIKVNEEKRIVKIGFDSDYEWDFKIITFESVKSLIYVVKPDEMADLSKILRRKNRI
jgi:hypothetical protein